MRSVALGPYETRGFPSLFHSGFGFFLIVPNLSDSAFEHSC